jgi:hypothetical protein
MTKIDRPGSASARRPATTQPAKPPDDVVRDAPLRSKTELRTSSDYHVDLIEFLRQFGVDTHVEILLL